jgi:hypothetical protein
MQKLTSGVCLGFALALSACGGPEAVEADSLQQQAQGVVTPVGMTLNGCDYTLSAVQVSNSPPIWDMTITRTAGTTACTLPLGASQVIGQALLNEPTYLSIAGTDAGIVGGYLNKNGFSGSSAIVYTVGGVNTTTLAFVRSDNAMCDYRAGNITEGSVSTAINGTKVNVFGRRNCKINGQPGNFYSAGFVDFFTSTTPPTYLLF